MTKLLVFLLANLVALSLAIQCLDDGDRLIGNTCYKLVDQHLTYSEAEDWCHFQNPTGFSYLASVTDQTTANFLATFATTTFGTNEGLFWIGLSRANTSSPFQWDDDQKETSWTNFQYVTSQNHVAERIANGKWITYGPQMTLPFVCSYDPSLKPTDGPKVCDPKLSNSTFLFGYSTELNSNVVRLVTEHIKEVISADEKNYKKFANVRLDNKNGPEPIHYHSDLVSFSRSVNENLPDSSLIYPSLNNQTDLFQIIVNFINSNSDHLCGSRLFFLLHRYPQADAGADRVIDYENLTANGVEIFLIKSIDGNGGVINSLYRLPAKTNGLLSFASQSSFLLISSSFMDAPYHNNLLFSYQSSDLKKNGTYYMGTLDTSNIVGTTVNVTLAISTGISATQNTFISLDLILENKTRGTNQTFVFDKNDLMGNSDLIYQSIEIDSGSLSEVYTTIYTTFYGLINIRIYI